MVTLQTTLGESLDTILFGISNGFRGINIPINNEHHHTTYDFVLHPYFKEILPMLEQLSQGTSRIDEKLIRLLRISNDHQESCEKKFKSSNNYLDLRCENYLLLYTHHIFVVLVGCWHNREYYEKHKDYLLGVGKEAAVICLEGAFDIPYGESSNYYWTNEHQFYGNLMRDVVAEGFDGVFAEVDMRDNSKIDFQDVKRLPDDFFKKWYEYLQRMFPDMCKNISGHTELRALMKSQSTADGISGNLKILPYRGVAVVAYPFTDPSGQIHYRPTGFELGEQVWADAMSAIKLYLIAKEMADGRLRKGPIVYFVGASHLSPLRFFINQQA